MDKTNVDGNGMTNNQSIRTCLFWPIYISSRRKVWWRRPK